jgi:hypothetical protein
VNLALPHPAWDPAVFPYAHLGMAWPAASRPVAADEASELEAPPAPGDRAGRFAALSLLLIAMLLWLFTALLFARGGFYHTGGPPVQQGSTLQYIQQMPQHGPQHGPGKP